MKKLKISLIGVLFIAVSAYAASTITWQVDTAHSKIQFIAPHMKISEVSGAFKKYSATIQTEGQNWNTADINVTIDVNSINTDNERRDGHLKSEEFFHAKKYPKITFESTDIEKVEEMDNGKTKYQLTGNLTMRGTTKKEEFTAIHNGTVKSPFNKKPKAGWKIKGTVDRYEYGLKWDKTTEAGNLVVGKQIDIVCDIELAPKNM